MSFHYWDWITFRMFFTADVVLNHADLTPFEESLRDLIGESTGIFELDIQNENAEVIEVSIDEYENGVKQDEILQFSPILRV